jgi:hypothetical protein
LKGYGPEQAYLWLREKIAQQDFQALGCEILESSYLHKILKIKRYAGTMKK